MPVPGSALILALLLAPVGPVGALTSPLPSDTTRSGEGPPDARRLLAVEAAAYAVSMVVLERTWYSDRKAVPFHFFDDSAGYLQVDKAGHAFGSYIESYVGLSSLKRLGWSDAAATWIGGSLGFVLQSPIEVMDGLHEGWGFSWSDIAANAAGSALVIGQQKAFGEQVALMKFSYSPSRYADQANGMFGTGAVERLLEDYNGHTYWLSAPLARLLGSDRVPDWLNVAVGYGADGMLGEFENLESFGGVRLPAAQRVRQGFLSLDVDWRRIRPRSRALRLLLTGLTFVKIPFPAIEVQSSGTLKAHWIHF